MGGPVASIGAHMGALIREYTSGIHNANGNTNQRVLAAADNAQSNLIGDYRRYTRLYKRYTRVYRITLSKVKLQGALISKYRVKYRVNKWQTSQSRNR